MAINGKKWLATSAAVLALGILAGAASAREDHRRPARVPSAHSFPASRGPATFHGPVIHGHHERVAFLAQRLERQARDVLSEVQRHFGYHSRFRYLQSDVLEMVRLTDHINDVARRSGNLSYLRSEVWQLDRLFHHVEELVDEMARSHRVDHYGLVHIRQELAEMGRTLHELRSVVS
jgi:hypothetical protein